MNSKRDKMKDNALYEKLRAALKYIRIHSIYERGQNGLLCAAADLTEPGKTYRILFRIDKNGTPDISKIERWYIG